VHLQPSLAYGWFTAIKHLQGFQYVFHNMHMIFVALLKAKILDGVFNIISQGMCLRTTLLIMKSSQVILNTQMFHHNLQSRF